MTAPARSWPEEAEREFLAGLRAQYVDQGFTFVVDPRPDDLPAFLGSYRPDAIAKKPGANIAIEVKQRPSPATEWSLTRIRRLFEGHPDWQLVVTYIGSDPLKTLTIPVSSTADIRRRAEEVRTLEIHGQQQAAFVMAWSLLEAALHRIESEKGARPRTPGTVVQTLAMLGYIDPALEQRVRPLIDLRNRIVHGDLHAEPSPYDVHLVLSAVEQALANDAS
ncbi:hypothetical protein C8P66_12664 [Humitalea rosea]|uniref:REase AHJR-like domain-containing protein n=1 Tax=Humitalea rosea TaxID=990373 RepID=A0A2W7I1I2_9PROT|nr:HepT-like ribonuclease domain-containing protein [Humitalea rosea]PZW40019.1 hypothetical protein C8P66_12664 [Humitalea rosea]